MDVRIAWLALPLLAACASTVDWSKPGATREAIDADVSACRRTAERIPTVPRLQSAPPNGPVGSTTGTDLDADRQLAQAQLVERCMRERGYRLVSK
jgi:hypothetical protein